VHIARKTIHKMDDPGRNRKIGKSGRESLAACWLPKRSPELNPMDTLWGQAKDAICVNTQYVDIDEQADAFIVHVSGLSNREALQPSGVLSKHFWLRRVLSKNFCGPA
jgi:hypothetical protein